MKAISIRQPFAQMILGTDACPGPKRVENRGRLWPGGRLNRWVPGEPGQEIEPVWFAVHTGKQLFDFGHGKAGNLAMEHERFMRQVYPECPPWRHLPTGALVGAMRVIGACHYFQHPDLEANPFANEGCTIWHVDAVVRLPISIPYRGRQGLWNLEAEHIQALREAREAHGIDTRMYPRPPGWDDYLSETQPERWQRVLHSRKEQPWLCGSCGWVNVKSGPCMNDDCTEVSP